MFERSARAHQCAQQLPARAAQGFDRVPLCEAGHDQTQPTLEPAIWRAEHGFPALTGQIKVDHQGIDLDLPSSGQQLLLAPA
jgi:hypothetical protein